MRQALAVFNSDQVNSQGYIMPLPVLCSALEQGWSPGQPLFLSHDRHRLQGWTVSLGLYLESGLARLTGISLLPENEEESEDIRQGLFSFLTRQRNAEVSPYRAELEDRLGPHLRGAQEEIYVDSAALIEPGLAQRAFPEIFSQTDKDGLVPVSALCPIADGVYERDGLLFFASDFFRRSLSRHNTLNNALLSRLQALVGDDKLTVKVRLDPDLVALAGTLRKPLEFAHWWGPKFNDDLKSIPRAITRHEASDRQRLFSGILRAEFWWHAQNGLQTFECEELRDIPSYGVNADTFGCRYAHSIITPDVNLPTHLDGAIRAYNEEAMLERMDKDMYRAGRHTEYVKIWRIDGPLDVSTWKELITHHFRDNELVGEYLGGVDDSDHIRPHIVTHPANTLASYVPTNMEAEMGVRVHVSYHDQPDGDVPDFSVVPFDTFARDDEKKSFVESDTYEIVKLLRRGGKTIVLPDNALRIAFEDTAINLAVIRHGGPAAAANAKQTLAAVATLCDAWVSRGDDRVITFCLDVVYGDRLSRPRPKGA